MTRYISSRVVLYLHWAKGYCFGFRCAAILEGNGALQVTMPNWIRSIQRRSGHHEPLSKHGEVVSSTPDGAETDLDLGHYERFVQCHHEPAPTTSHWPCVREVLCARSAGVIIWARPIQVHSAYTRDQESASSRVPAMPTWPWVEIGAVLLAISNPSRFLEAIAQLRVEVWRKARDGYLHLTCALYRHRRRKPRPSQNPAFGQRKLRPSVCKPDCADSARSDQPD